jgi:hypothetical protein
MFLTAWATFGPVSRPMASRAALISAVGTPAYMSRAGSGTSWTASAARPANRSECALIANAWASNLPVEFSVVSSSACVSYSIFVMRTLSTCIPTSRKLDSTQE